MDDAVTILRQKIEGYFEKLENVKYVATAKVSTKNRTEQFAWRFEYSGAGDKFWFRDVQIPLGGNPVVGARDVQVASDDVHLQFLNGSQLSLIPLNTAKTDRLQKLEQYINTTTRQSAALVLPWFFVSKAKALQVNSLKSWQDVLTSPGVVERISKIRKINDKGIELVFSQEPGIFEGTMMTFSVQWRDNIPFPIAWDFRAADGSGLRYEVAEIGEAASLTSGTPVYFPKTAKWLVYSGENEVYSESLVTIDEFSLGNVQETDFQIDPAQTSQVFDLENEVEITVPR